MSILHYWHSCFIRWLYSKAQLGMFQYHMFFSLVCRFFCLPVFAVECVVFSCVCGCFSSSTSEDRWEYMCCPLPVQEALVHLVGLLPTIPTVLKNQFICKVNCAPRSELHYWSETKIRKLVRSPAIFSLMLIYPQTKVFLHLFHQTVGQSSAIML